ncbi:MAG: response regulator [Lachnospiraceae bacterium]|nr:response regulator [Lachnospiraceae bacterium]
MDFSELMNNRFGEPALILSVMGDEIAPVDINDRYLPEIGMNLDKNDYLSRDYLKAFTSDSLVAFKKAVQDVCAGTEEIRLETWRRLVSNCCGEENIYVRSRLIDLGVENGIQYIYEGVRNITLEHYHPVVDVDQKDMFAKTAESNNIYYWEYTVATHEMRPCFRCMRDLGLPAVVRNYPEPAIDAGIFPLDYADMYRDWHRQIEEKGVPGFEAIIPLTVARVPFRVKLTTEYDEDGKPVKILGSATIIPETEKKKNALDDSIITTLAGEYGGIYLIDLDKDEMEAIIEDPRIKGYIPKKCTYSQEVGRIISKYARSADENVAFFANLEFLRHALFKEGKRREMNFKISEHGPWARLSCRAVEYDEDTVSKMLITYTLLDDHRSQKLDDDQTIAQQKKELEARQAKLVEAVDEANRANRAKSDFLAKMSHEIRTPMNAIMGMNEIIMKSPDVNDEIRGYATDAYRASEGLLSIINEILDFSRIESGRLELVNERFDLGAFLVRMYNMFVMRAEGKGLALSVEASQDLPRYITSDENRLMQVLNNLVSNAVKYTDSGVVTLKVSSVPDGETARLITFEVVDTGRGIRQEDLSKLFQAFERIDVQNNRNIEGTGLGLNIAYRIVEKMDSRLEVESEFGQGTRFYFTVRLECEPYVRMGDFHSCSAVTSTENEKPIFVNPDKRILVVDDNIVNLKVIKALLKDSKMTVIEVTSGAQALRAAGTRKFDLIFMDHYMSGMDGVETLFRIREQEDGPNRDTPVIALTANAIKGAYEKYRELGFVDVVFKPTTLNDLNDMLWKYCGDK